jgi:hypothetical protein
MLSYGEVAAKLRFKGGLDPASASVVDVAPNHRRQRPRCLIHLLLAVTFASCDLRNVIAAEVHRVELDVLAQYCAC